MKHQFLIALACLVTVACGSGYHGPIDPSPNVPPAAMSFTPEAGPFQPRSFILQDGHEGIGNEIAVQIHANDFTSGFSLFRGTLVYDSRVITLLDYTEAGFLKQDGALATFSVTGIGTNHATVRIDRPSSLGGAFGSGAIIILRFKPATLEAKGTTALQWDDPHAYTSSFHEVLQQTYGGTVTVTR